MANSKLIVIEGPQGAGKTTVTDYIRHTLSSCNLYRLSGSSDTTKDGLRKSTEMYNDLLDYLKKLENLSIHLLFDRTFFTEENYCRLGKKDYSFTEVYNSLLEKFANLDFEIYYITLYLKDTSVYEERLNRSDKVTYEASKFSAQNSITQQEMYLQMANEIKEKYPNIIVENINTDDDLDNIKQKIRDIIKY